MLHMKKSLSKMAVLALTVSMLAAGCSDAGKEEPAKNASGNETTVTEQPTAPPATEEPTVTDAPTSTEATEPAETEKPTATEDTTKENETGVKPSATAKPTQKPSGAKPDQKPAATAKPTQKPTQKPTVKPTQKPGATQKPSATPKPPVKPSTDIKVSDITTKITTDLEYPMLGNVEAERLKDVFGTDFDGLVTEGVYLQAMMNVKATELAIVKLKSDKSYDAVAEAFEARAADIQKTFETYLQDQYEDAKNYKIVRNGNYVMLSISHDQDAVLKIFNSFFK
ncbi:DUF4358 domain-containing protein [Bacillus sp. FJAT-28004]|uniref:DUF4358 domain-containing protein n=1 Tax=Bacillus sp. FJAT-28004 TaxID=1679165 RepID=UPI0006B5F077|nr:DUF4358 domain-containing protein [Bacillus sp. FJAT-28004]